MSIPTTSASPAEIAEFLRSGSDKPVYVVVYSSTIGGDFWCGDCRSAEPLVNEKFANRLDAVRVVLAGQRDEWRSKDNVWRQKPFLVTALPTIIKAKGNDDWERLVEADVYDPAKLDAFVD